MERAGLGVGMWRRLLCSLNAVLIFSLLILQVETASAGMNEWTSNGPEGGGIFALTVAPSTPSTLYAGTDGGGVFKSTNGGASWLAVNSGLTDKYIRSLAVDPTNSQIIYAGAGAFGGVFRSIDSGASWSAVNNGLSNKSIMSIAIDPITPTTLYVGTFGGGVFKSTNSGDIWISINTGLSMTTIFSLAIVKENPVILYAGGRGGIFKSTNGGEEWGQVNTDMSSSDVYTVAIHPTVSSTIYVGGNSGLFKSDNSGDNWNYVSTGIGGIDSIIIDPSTQDIMYAKSYSDGGIYKSTNGGGVWSAVNDGLSNRFIDCMIIDPTTTTTIYAGTKGGVFKSFNSGETWSEIDTGLGAVLIMSLIFEQNNSTILYAGTRSGVYKSADAGWSWSAVNSGLRSLYINTLAINPSDSSTIFAGANGLLFKTTNAGETWSEININGLINIIWKIVYDPLTPSTMYIGALNGVFKSTDGGDTWIEINSGLTNTTVFSLAIDPVTPTTIYAGTNSGVFKSTNSGETWTLNGQSGYLINSMAISSTTPTTIYAGTHQGVYKSTNGDGVWIVLNSGLTSTWISSVAILPSKPTTIYVGTSNGVFKSNNSGSTWNPVSGLTADIRSLAIDPMNSMKIYAGTFAEGGVYSYTFTLNTLTVTSSNPSSEVNIGITPSDINGSNNGDTQFTSTFTQGTIVTLTAPATAGGSTYNSWTGCDSVNGTQCTVALTTDKSVTISYGPLLTIPAGVTSTTGNGQGTISWNAVPGAASYNLYYSTTPGVTTATGTKVANVTSPYTVSSLTNGTPYYFVVTAENANGEGAESAEVGAVPGMANAYTQADLTGIWELNTLASGPGAPWWGRGTLTIAANGTFTGTFIETDDNTAESISGTFNLTSDGIATTTGVNTNFQCRLDVGKTVLVCTTTWGGTHRPGTAEMSILTKKAASYTAADLAGEWGFSSLKTPGPYWERGVFTIDSNGAFTGNTTDSDGGTNTGSGTFNVTAEGVITPAGVDMNPSRCVMDSGKTIIVCTSTSNSTGDSELQVLTRKGSSYTQADLTGLWQVNTLISPTAWWGRGPFTIGADGSFTFSMSESDSPDIETITGTFSMNTDGIVTGVSAAITDSFSCEMDAGKTIIACSATGSDGDSNLMIFAKQALPSAITLTDLTITTGPSSLNESSSATFATTATWSDATTTVVTPTWSVTPTTYASINSSSGVLTTLAVPSNQSVTVTASYTADGITMTASQVVTITDVSVIDSTPPDTTITGQPVNPSTESTASFSFTATEANSTFECKLDSGTFAPCTTPKAYTGLTAGSHTFQVKATDTSGNIDATPASYTWTIDLNLTNGTIVINGGALYTESRNVTLSLASYPIASKMQLFYNNISWTKPAAFTATKAIVLPIGQGLKTVKVRYLDQSGVTMSEYTATITLDTKAPTGTMKINGGALYTNTRTVMLETTALDVTSGINKICLKESNLPCTDGEFVSFSATRAFEITSPGDGIKKVYATLKDNAGKLSVPLIARITLDTVAPTGSIIINGGKTTTTAAAVVLTLTAVKASNMQLSFDGGANWGNWVKFVGSKNVTLTTGYGEVKISVRFKDNAGNVSPDYSDTIDYSVYVPKTCSGKNNMLTGDWYVYQGNSASYLPEHIGIKKANTGYNEGYFFFYNEDGTFDKYIYVLDEDCGSIMLIRTTGQLYRTYNFNISANGLELSLWDKSRYYCRGGSETCSPL